ncbi:MAG: folate-binding protein YgfZ [Chitinophagaceae bacterium]|nr:folate-binding protein YgfZ [Polaromonas sp.]
MNGGTTALTDLGLISASGADASTFLQGQLTQDVLSMTIGESRLAAFCNAKGRMQASFWVVKRADNDYALVCSLDILAQTLKRLGLFVMRAKVKLRDASADFSIWGLVGENTISIASKAYKTPATDNIDHFLVHLRPAVGQARALWCAPGAGPPLGDALQPGLWAWLDVQAGIARVTLPIFEAFVPQMLNYESVGGVNFKKGCYPGQEVVARSQFRGTLKRRTYLVVGQHPAASEPMAVAQAVFHALDAEQPCGMVAAWATNPFTQNSTAGTAGDTHFAALVSMQTSAAQNAVSAHLTLGHPGGTVLTLQPLPYPLLEDI